MKESIQEAAGHVVHDLERYLNTLGTIAAVAPLLGLLGTVVGMIKVFAEIMAQGTGNASALAGGISAGPDHHRRRLDRRDSGARDAPLLCRPNRRHRGRTGAGNHKAG